VALARTDAAGDEDRLSHEAVTKQVPRDLESLDDAA
jgi:hypothetical protein